MKELTIAERLERATAKFRIRNQNNDFAILVDDAYVAGFLDALTDDQLTLEERAESIREIQ